MSVKRRKGSKTYYTNFTHNGQRVRKSTGTANKAQAQEYEDKLKERLWRQKKLGDRIIHTWPEAANRYLQNNISHKKQKGQANDKAIILWFTKQLGDISLENITEDVIENLILKLKGYEFYLVSKRGAPKIKLENGAIYLYRDKSPEQIFALIRPLKESKKTINLNTLAKNLGQEFLLKQLNWENADNDLLYYSEKIDPKLISLIMSNCKPSRKPATINRYLAVLRPILRLAAHKWKDANQHYWLSKMPQIEELNEGTYRIRWITIEEAERLIEVAPEHLKPAIIFSLATGLRLSNALLIEWSQINEKTRQAWVHADQAKGKEAISVPLNETAIKVLAKEKGKHPIRVFTYRGKPFKRPSSDTWHRCLEKANIKDYRWHDMRHTWASWHVQNGTRLSVLMELGGWSSYEMVLRYAHLSSEHLKREAERVDLLNNKNWHKIGTPE